MSNTKDNNSRERKSNDKSKRGKNRRNRQNKVNSANTPAIKFKGRTSELEKSIYDVGVQNQADIIANTNKEIANYTGCHCKDPSICTAIEQLEEVTIPAPVARNLETPLVA